MVKKIKTLIEQSNLSLLALSRRANISRVYLYSIINETTKTIKYDKLSKICNALNVNIADMV